MLGSPCIVYCFHWHRPWWFKSCFNCSVHTDTYGQAASTLLAGTNLEQTIQQIMDMGGGNWDRETVTRALRAAYNNPERAVDYLYSVCLDFLNLLLLYWSLFSRWHSVLQSIPETAEVAVPVGHFPASQATETGAANAAPVSGAPNSAPLNMFPQVKCRIVGYVSFTFT